MTQNKKIEAPKRPQGPMGGPMGGGPMSMGPGEKAKDAKGTLKKLLKYLSPYYVGLIFVLIFAIASTVFTVVGPKILGEATTVLVEGMMAKITNSGSIDFTEIGRIITLLIFLYLISALFTYIQGFIMTKISNNVTYNLRKEINSKIERLPFAYFDKHNYGEVLSHITNDVDALNMSLSQGITQLITSVTSIIGVLYMMFSINWQMSLVALGVLPVSFGLIAIIMKTSQKFFKDQQKYLGMVNGQVEEMYSNHVIVKSFNGEKQAVANFSQYNDELYDSAWKSQFFSGMMQPIMSFLGNIGYVIVAILGGYFAAQGTLSIGSIQSFIQYMRSFTQPIAQIASQSNALQSTLAASEKIFKLLEEGEETPDPVDALPIADIKGDVGFAHVKFGYNPEKIVIHDFKAHVNAGQKIAIVGPTGAGKTTMVKLLMRFYDVTDGAILVDYLDIRQFKRNDLRTMFGMVLQDTWLYNDTIRENIRYGRLDATDEEVYQAAKMAQVDHFVQTLPDGYDMILNEESSNISAGQKQLMTIARAILANPKVLILDEATSSVDTRTEILIQKAMDVLMEGRTSFIIAHRLSTIRNADLILVMNLGDIVESGSHDELLAKGGFYANLYNSQFDEGEEELA
jgi:ATP-binding cassette, subfamily B, multidrug efflux pump